LKESLEIRSYDHGNLKKEMNKQDIMESLAFKENENLNPWNTSKEGEDAFM